MSRRLTKELAQKWIEEADRWAVGYGVDFEYKDWDIGIRKVDDAFESYRFGLNGRRKGTGETISRPSRPRTRCPTTKIRLRNTGRNDKCKDLTRRPFCPVLPPKGLNGRRYAPAIGSTMTECSCAGGAVSRGRGW